MIFYCAKLHLPKCKGSCVISIKLLQILIFNRPSCPFFAFFTKMFLVKFVNNLVIYQNTKFRDSTLKGSSLEFVLEFEQSLRQFEID
jgi:hypothetical protein